MKITLKTIKFNFVREHPAHCLATVISWFGSILCYLPVLLKWDYNITGFEDGQDLPIQRALSTRQLEYSLLASVAVSIPMICELAADTILTTRSFGVNLKSHYHVIFSKWVLLIALLIPNLILLIIIVPNEDYVYIPVIYTSRQIILYHTLLIFMGSYGQPIWTPRITSLLSIIFTLGQLLECFTAFTIMSSILIQMMKILLFISVSIILVWTTFRWFLHIKFKLFDFDHKLSINENYCNVHLMAILIAFVGLWGLFVAFQSETWASTNETYLSVMSYIEIIYTIVLSVWSGRIARREIAIQQSKRELETKRMFVRYVSHEIRTPLNTVGMGLQLLRAELAKIRDNEAMLDIVQDLSVSCDTAVDILNDLLTYEKLTANILQLDSAVISVKKFVSEVVRPFFMQARQAGIELSIVFGGDLLDESVDVNIFGDKNKLSQVVRNLVSNALKFTKNEGQVIISVSNCTEQEADDNTSSRGLLSQYLSTRSSRHKFNLKPTPSFKSSKRIHISESSARNNNNNNNSNEIPLPVPDVDRESGNRGRVVSRCEERSSVVDVNNLSMAPVANESSRTRGKTKVNKTHWLKIAVTDCGVGISEENQKRLFKEIVQFNPGELQDGKGSGLGLWISSRIMELHGGDLTVFSKGIGHGCTFTLIAPVRDIVILPQTEHKTCPVPFCSSPSRPSSLIGHDLTRLEAFEKQGSHRSLVTRRRQSSSNRGSMFIPSKGGSAAASPTGSVMAVIAMAQGISNALQTALDRSSIKPRGGEGYSHTVPMSHFLLVDDAPMNRKMLNRLLKDRCGTISEAEDGKQALDMVLATLRDPSRPAIDVVIMDNLMPVMDGPTAVREMRSAGYRGIVIGLTGHALPADIQWFLSHGADRVMIKPCNMEELDGILRDLMVQNDALL